MAKVGRFAIVMLSLQNVDSIIIYDEQACSAECAYSKCVQVATKHFP
jgi:hypothetical protein